MMLTSLNIFHKRGIVFNLPLCIIGIISLKEKQEKMSKFAIVLNPPLSTRNNKKKNIRIKRNFKEFAIVLNPPLSTSCRTVGLV